MPRRKIVVARTIIAFDEASYKVVKALGEKFGFTVTQIVRLALTDPDTFKRLKDEVKGEGEKKESIGDLP